jgi:hypothetical protein
MSARIRRGIRLDSASKAYLFSSAVRVAKNKRSNRQAVEKPKADLYFLYREEEQEEIGQKDLAESGCQR